MSHATIHNNWDSPAFKWEPIAARTGPFPGGPFLEAWWSARSTPGDQLMLAESDAGLIAAYLSDGVLQFAGEGDLTDYHSPLGADVAGPIAALVKAAGPGISVVLDSLPEEAAGPTADALAACGMEPTVETHEVAAVLSLPASFDEYLADLTKKERHEMRRKRRRFGEMLGTPHIERSRSAADIEWFAEMHRAAQGDKGEFMDSAMEELFKSLMGRAGGFLDTLYGDGGEPMASAFSFEDDDGYYLYNSAYDPAHRDASPGVVMLSLLIEASIADGRDVFDFLKGDEHYKFRLGAEPRPLFVVKAQS